MASDRRTHSSIDKLPAEIREAVIRMIVDGEWPDDFPEQVLAEMENSKAGMPGKPRYEDMVTYCLHKGHKIAQSSMGRFGKRMRVMARMKNAGAIARETMDGLTGEHASKTQKAVAEIITAQIIEIAAEDNLSTKQIRELATAVKDCTAVSISADKYIREQIEKKIEAATQSTKKKLTKAGVNQKLIQEIMDEHLGVTK